MTVRLIKLAVVYLVLGMSLGIGMGIAQDHTLRGVHAHVNLLGWATLSLAALVFHVFPQLGETRLAAIWFWLYNLALPVALVSFGFVSYGEMWAMPGVKAAFLLVWAAGVMFAANVMINLRSRASAAAQLSQGRA